MIVPPIVIDTNDLMSQYSSLTKENIDSMLDNIAKGLAASFAQQLSMSAEQELHGTRKRYVNNIRCIDTGKLEGTVLLDYSKDPLIKMLEEGAGPFDMKKYFLASPKVKIGKKGGRYLTIPFRWGVPGTIGEEDNFTFIMPMDVYKIVKKQPLSINVSGGGTRSPGLSLKELPTYLQVKQKRAPIYDDKGNELFKEYEHKGPIHQGISKYNDPKTGQNTYRSFRRVSENSDDAAFIHPGIKRYNLIQKTLGSFNIVNELSPLIDNELEKYGLL